MRIIFNFICVLFIIVSCNNKQSIDLKNYISFLRNIDSTFYTYHLYIGMDKNFYFEAKKLYIDNVLSDTINIDERLYKYTTNSIIVKNIGYKEYEIFSSNFKQDKNKLYILFDQDSILLKYGINENGIRFSYNLNIGQSIDRDLKIMEITELNFNNVLFKDCIMIRLIEDSGIYINFYFHPEKGLIQYEIITPENYTIAFLDKDFLSY